MQTMVELSPALQEKKLQEIIQVLEAHQHLLSNVSYSRGLLGVAILHGLLAKQRQDALHAAKARTIFEEAHQRMNSKPFKSLFLDLSELGIAATFLNSQGVLSLDLNDYLSEVDELLARQMRQYIDQGQVGGFVSGALSMGVYFLHRFQAHPQVSQQCLSELAEAISGLAIRSPKGWYWKNQAALPGKEACLSMPHGSAAMIIFLSRIAELGILSQQQLYPIIEKSLTFITHHQRPGLSYHFPDWLNYPSKGRISLCYGDMGVGYAFLKAGIVFSQSDWQATARKILSYCAAKPQKVSRVKDAGIMFGATGLGLMFQKIYRHTQEEVYCQASKYWFHHVFTYANQTDGYAGFKGAYNQWNAYTNLSFCEGIIGIGCGLMASLQPDCQGLDELIWLF